MSSTVVPDAVAEIERKYEAAAELDLPDLSRLSAGLGEAVHDSIQLSATYFDTADFRLLGKKITLRKREGGDDAGWHLKLPGAEDLRTEYRLPPSDGADVPSGLSDLVRAVVRGHDLVPVALIITDRERYRFVDEHGALHAEVVSDTVMACRADGSEESTWQEVEVEQGAGGVQLADAIDTLLLSAGLERSASPSKLKRALGSSVTPHVGPATAKVKRATSGVLLRNYVVEQTRELVEADLATRRDESESIHRFRVAARRLRSAVQSYARQSDVTDDLVADLRWIGAAFGAARDVEVQWMRLVDRLSEIDDLPEPESTRARIDEFFSAREDTARTIILEALNSHRYVSLLDRLDRYADELDTTTTEKKSGKRTSERESARTLRHLARKVGSRVDAVTDADSRADRDEAIHGVRKSAKRMKYAIEVLQPVSGHRARRALKEFSRFQDVLGEHQDSVVAREHLLDMSESEEHTSVTSFALGMIYQHEVAVTEGHAALLRKNWKKAVKSSQPLWR
ncbi:CHAD domain-containing protein [Rhodococcus sp. 27YEA15]|uniref:CYTH and CHAD domain-containing protein n=1 Tax=Rhodococcus sp. 27YEA15 TaxID=3156259 RepID=UPI003C7B5F5D